MPPRIRHRLIAATAILTVAFLGSGPAFPSPASHDPSHPNKRAPAAPPKMAIDSSRGWQRMPVSVNEGERFFVFYVSGSWTVDRRNYARVGAEGYPEQTDSEIYQPCKLDRDGPFGELMGRVGENGEPFPVGSGGEFTSRDTGPIYLRINDHDRCLNDNDGSLNVAASKATHRGIARGLLSQLQNQLQTLQPEQKAAVDSYFRNASTCFLKLNSARNTLPVECAAAMVNFLQAVRPGDVE
ncbi:hypothetical protein QFZ43_002933 [Streptomyces afghaniensis]|nr:hypothetical protein [Streptomyces afghaniensis]